MDLTGWYAILKGRPVGTLEQLARTLSAQCSQAGLALYLPESYASLAPDCRVLVSSVVTSGTLSRRLEYAMERWGADRVVLAVEAAAEDFPLPADGRGSPLGPERLQELMDRLEPAVFFDRGLCAHYFTYMPRAGQAILSCSTPPAPSAPSWIWPRDWDCTGRCWPRRR